MILGMASQVVNDPPGEPSVQVLKRIKIYSLTALHAVICQKENNRGDYEYT